MAWPDVVGLLVAYLDSLTTARVGSRVPHPMPNQLVQVRRVGGRALSPVRDLARVDVIAWASKSTDAGDLALEMRGHVWALAGTSLLGGVPTYRVSEFMGPRQDDDDLPAGGAETSGGGSARVWATYELVLRANAAIQPAPNPAP